VSIERAANGIVGLLGEKGEEGMARLEDRKGMDVMRGGGMAQNTNAPYKVLLRTLASPQGRRDVKTCFERYS